MKRKSLLALLLALALCLSCMAACGGGTDDGQDLDEPPAGDGGDQGEAPGGDQGGDEVLESQVDMDIPEGTTLGQRLADFTFTTYDGQTHSLYETLAEKKMVLINLWATWCGPCQAEFPYMETAYQEYKDDIEIFAMSVEDTDNDDVLADYVADMGMTFPVGQDGPNLDVAFKVTAIPTSVVVDRFGVICFIEANSQSSADNFRRLFDVFVGDDYTESVLLDGIPGPKPTVEATDPADLAAALNVESGSLVFENPQDESDWPMKIMNKNDRTYAMSTNKNMSNTTSLVTFTVSVSAGDVLALDYLVSTEADYDFMTVYIDDMLVKCISGERDWSTWAYEFKEAGDYTVTLAYEKDAATDGGSDLVCFDDVRVLSASDGAALLADMPSYPHGADTTVALADPDARQVVINDPTGLVAANFGDAASFIITGDTADFTITLTEGVDAEAASINCSVDGTTTALSDLVSGDHYAYSAGVSATSTYNYVQLSPSPFEEPIMLLYFSGEEALNTFIVRNFSEDDGTLSASWKYADGSAPASTAVRAGSDAIAEGSSLYYLVFVDQNGDPVEGVTANVCDDDTCTPMVSDANGMIGFVYESFAYHIQVIKVPDGYTYDTSAESYLTEDGGVTEFVVTKQ